MNKYTIKQPAGFRMPDGVYVNYGKPLPGPISGGACLPDAFLNKAWREVREGDYVLLARHGSDHAREYDKRIGFREGGVYSVTKVSSRSGAPVLVRTSVNSHETSISDLEGVPLFSPTRWCEKVFGIDTSNVSLEDMNRAFGSLFSCINTPMDPFEVLRRLDHVELGSVRAEIALKEAQDAAFGLVGSADYDPTLEYPNMADIPAVVVYGTCHKPVSIGSRILENGISRGRELEPVEEEPLPVFYDPQFEYPNVGNPIKGWNPGDVTKVVSKDLRSLLKGRWAIGPLTIKAGDRVLFVLPMTGSPGPGDGFCQEYALAHDLVTGTAYEVSQDWQEDKHEDLWIKVGGGVAQLMRGEWLPLATARGWADRFGFPRGNERFEAARTFGSWEAYTGVLMDPITFLDRCINAVPTQFGGQFMRRAARTLGVTHATTAICRVPFIKPPPPSEADLWNSPRTTFKAVSGVGLREFGAMPPANCSGPASPTVESKDDVARRALVTAMLSAASHVEFSDESKALVEEFARIAIDNAKVFAKKQADYGPANIEGFGELGVLIRLNDKVARLRNLAGKVGGTVNESITDSWLDVANYGVIAQMIAAGKWPRCQAQHRLTASLSNKPMTRAEWASRIHEALACAGIPEGTHTTVRDHDDIRLEWAGEDERVGRFDDCDD